MQQVELPTSHYGQNWSLHAKYIHLIATNFKIILFSHFIINKHPNNFYYFYTHIWRILISDLLLSFSLEIHVDTKYSFSLKRHKSARRPIPNVKMSEVKRPYGLCKKSKKSDTFTFWIRIKRTIYYPTCCTTFKDGM